MQTAIRINSKDNVAVALRDMPRGASFGGVTLSEDIRAGHKFALGAIPAGGPVVKYGYPIGAAAADILPGAWVHSHNLKTRLSGTLEYRYQPDWKPVPTAAAATFQGYRRKNGKVGVRNEVWIIPTVGCVNAIAKEMEREARMAMPAGVEGVTAYTHPHGCSQLGEDHQNTQKALCGLINHPNAGAVLVLGLGCENNHIAELKKVLGAWDEERVRFLNCQDCDDEIESARPILRELMNYAARSARESCPAGELIVGMKCGGSDGFSGITANPLVGDLAVRLAGQNGTVLLTEVPEMFGAETILMNRCTDEGLFGQTVELINNFKEYFLRYGQPVGENPSPGNKEGGITTLEEKSLGCVQKGADVPVSGVLGYGDPVAKRGLSLLQAPGNDLVASTALAVSGAQLVLFTTGRGTPFACPVPTVKISSNSALAQKKRGWIDYDAGRLLSGEGMDSLGADFFDYILKVASGEMRAKSEALEKNDLAIFKDGVTL